MNLSLAARLSEAAEWLVDGIPEETRTIQLLEGDVRPDELDLYCVNLMREAAEALSRDDAPTVVTFKIDADDAVEGITLDIEPTPELPTNPDPPQAA